MSQGAGYYIDSQGNKKKLFGGALVNVGHKIKNAFNTLMPQRATLKFGGYLNVSDDDENYMTVIDDAPIEVEWTVWQNMTDVQKAGKRWKIINAPSSSLTGNDVAYDTSLSVNEKIDSKVSKSGGTVSGTLYVDREDGTTSAVGISQLVLGNSTASGTAGNSMGAITLYGKGSARLSVNAENVSSNKTINFPDKAGVLNLNYSAYGSLTIVATISKDASSSQAWVSQNLTISHTGLLSFTCQTTGSNPTFQVTAVISGTFAGFTQQYTAFRDYAHEPLFCLPVKAGDIVSIKTKIDSGKCTIYAYEAY